MSLDLEKDNIKIVFHLETLSDDFLPIIHVFYLKGESNILFFKKIKILITILKNDSSSSIFEHLEKNWNNYYKNLFQINQYKCTRKDILNSFSYFTNLNDKISNEMYNKKLELISLLRKQKINRVLQ